MAKSYKESISVNLTGVYLVKDDVLYVEIEDIGVKRLDDILEKFKNEVITMSIKKVDELD